MFHCSTRHAIAAVALLAAPVFAQVAPPPPPPAEPEPTFEPPPMPPPRPATPARPQRATVTKTTDLPDIPYPGLWKFCGTEDPDIDEVCRFEDNLHYVALRANPTISPGMVGEIQPVIVARRARFELLVIENLDVAMQIDAGLLNEFGISDPVALQELLEVVKPLTPPTNLTQELQGRDVLTATQARFNNKIISEYQRAYGDFLRRTDPDHATDRFMRSMFEDSLIESMQALDGMLNESRGRMDRALAAVSDLPAEAEAQLRALAVDDIRIDPLQIDESADKVKLAWRPLSTEQKKQFLTAVREARATPEIPPVPVISVMHAGKRIVEGDPPIRPRVHPEQTDGEKNEIKTEQDDG